MTPILGSLSPTKLSDHPGYVDACVKLADLEEQLRDIERNIEAANTKISQKSLEQLADQLIFTGGIEEETAAPSSDELGRLMRNRQITRMAIDKQRVEVSNQKGIASRMICDAARPEYQKIMRKCSEAVIEIAKAFEAQRQFHRNLGANEVAFSGALPAQPFRDLDVSDPSSAVAYWLREAVEHGHIQASELPTEWRRTWNL